MSPDKKQIRKEVRAKRSTFSCLCLMWRLYTPYQLGGMGNLNEVVTSKRSQAPLHVLGRPSARQATSAVWGLQSSWNGCVYCLQDGKKQCFRWYDLITVISIQSRRVHQLTFNSLFKGWAVYAEWCVEYLVLYFHPLPPHWKMLLILISGQSTAGRQLYPKHRLHECREVMY